MVEKPKPGTREWMIYIRSLRKGKGKKKGEKKSQSKSKSKSKSKHKSKKKVSRSKEGPLALGPLIRKSEKIYL